MIGRWQPLLFILCPLHTAIHWKITKTIDGNWRYPYLLLNAVTFIAFSVVKFILFFCIISWTKSINKVLWRYTASDNYFFLLLILFIIEKYYKSHHEGFRLFWFFFKLCNNTTKVKNNIEYFYLKFGKDNFCNFCLVRQ